MGRGGSGADPCRRHSYGDRRHGSRHSSKKPSPSGSARDPAERERDKEPRAGPVPGLDGTVVSSTSTSSLASSSGDKGWDRTCGLESAARLCSRDGPGADPDGLACSLRTAPFAFQKRKARIDWRTLHAVDVDKLIREADIDILESVVDTIAFGDIAGEDTRNFTEANFLKIFQLAQLMVEYLLHVQEVLATHKAELIKAGSTLQEQIQRLRAKYRAQRDALAATRRELKQTKKTMHTYEVLLRTQQKISTPTVVPPSTAQQVCHCPFCEKVFESTYFLELHISRRHPKSGSNHITEEKIIAVVTKEDARTAQIAPDTTAALHAELQQLRTAAQADAQRAEAAAQAQIATLQSALRDSNFKLLEVQSKLDSIQSQIQASSTADVHHQLASLQNQLIASSSANSRFIPGERPTDKDSNFSQEKLRELELKFINLDHQLGQLHQENSRLVKELESAYQEVDKTKSEKEQQVTPHEHRDQIITSTTISISAKGHMHEGHEREGASRQNQQLRRPLPKEHGRIKVSPDSQRKPKELKSWFKEMGHEDTTRAGDHPHPDLARDTDEDGDRDEQGVRRPATAKRHRRDKVDREVGHDDPDKRYTDAVTEVGEGAPWMTVPQKEKWLKEHTFSPLGVPKFPHSSPQFKAKHDELVDMLDSELEREMKKYGVQPGAEGLSDTKYATAAASLEKERQMRYEQARAAERRMMESERGAVLWQTERAVHTRDVQQIESNFDQPSVSASRLSENSETDGNHGSQEEEEQEEEYLQDPRRAGRGMAHDFAGSDSDRGYRSEESDFYARRKYLSSSLDRRAPFAPAPFVTKHGEESQFMQQASGYGVLPERLEEEEVDESGSPGKEGTLSSPSAGHGRDPREAETDREEMELGLGDWASDNESDAAKLNNGSQRRSLIDKQLTEQASLALSRPQTPKHAGGHKRSPGGARGSPLYGSSRGTGSPHQNGHHRGPQQNGSPRRAQQPRGKARSPPSPPKEEEAESSVGRSDEDSKILDELGAEIDEIIRL